MNNIPLLELVGKNNRIAFSHYKEGVFFYYLPRVDGTEVYTFPVPVEEIENGTLKSEDKAITFMKWIRQAITDGTLLKEEE